MRYGLKCYKCVSKKSWDDCASVKIEKTCSSGEDRCSKAYFSRKSEGVSAEGFDKDCRTSAECDGFEKTDFCKGKECKSTAALVISAMLLHCQWSAPSSSSHALWWPLHFEAIFKDVSQLPV
ncbi:hypothetical protein OS493_037955 [Desmophyllum pertusum]|uniref:Uncharacterized protein n=1 Tax=Desmophyllum pertusum TaxID=174260 RepID=A0A9W9Z7Q1_9CNID|nr:hypothetical protein OS493_037955 [Desmophyllum pertusum]